MNRLDKPSPPCLSDATNNGGLAGKATDGFSLVPIIAGKAQRFRVQLSESDLAEQRDHKMKYLKLLVFSDFAPVSEEAFEDWVDLAARQVSRHRVACELFQEAWSAVASEELAGIIEEVPKTEDYEELINSVATVLFPSSSHLTHRIEGQIASGKRAATVYQARQWISKFVARYQRLCQRHGFTVALTNERLKQSALLSIPLILVKDLRRTWYGATWDEIWASAARLEQDLIEEHGELPEPLGAYPAVVDQEMGVKEPSRLRGPHKDSDPTQTTCSACGESGHFRHSCRYKAYRCRNCHRIGHLAKACKSLVVKDEKGRVDARLETKQTGTVLSQRKDKSQTEKMVSMEAVLGTIRDIAEKRAAKSADLRRKRKEKMGWTRQRKLIEHEIGVAHDTDSSGNDNYSSTDEEPARKSDLDKIADALLQLNAEDAADCIGNETVTVVAYINGNRRKVVMLTLNVSPCTTLVFQCECIRVVHLLVLYVSLK